MRLVHLDAVGGVAGDMFAAAMLDALPALGDRVLADVRAVLPADASAALEEGKSGAVRVLRFRVTPPPDGDHHGHHHHAMAAYPDIMARIEAAPLAAGTARHAGAILTVLGEAEAAVHGVALAEVHFHEIGNWDSLADVVAAGSIAAALGKARWTVSDLPLGGGLVRTQHGLLPVPPPATTAILAGFAWRDDGIAGERVTPTGAAILRHLGCTRPGPGTRTLAASGTGAGTRELAGMPNILRALVFEDRADDHLRDRVAVIGFDIDDMTGEELADAAERIRGCPGVLDVSITVALGKKGRPLNAFRVLAREEALEAARLECLRQTTTLGLRWRIEERVVLAREEGGEAGVRVKAARRPDGNVTVKAESDDLRDARDLADRRRRQHEAEAGHAP
jgi:pyridinium-3,5-bisthiocarboxylic acid mononucleotide nickel chelatase